MVENYVVLTTFTVIDIPSINIVNMLHLSLLLLLWLRSNDNDNVTYS